MADGPVSNTEAALGAFVTLIMIAVPAWLLRWAWQRITQ